MIDRRISLSLPYCRLLRAMLITLAGINMINAHHHAYLVALFTSAMKLVVAPEVWFVIDPMQ
ncbi:Hypothetical protein NGAL_HAMBI490_51290 [Neorhizobium galegae bv. officinalis]|nr:Hypothetical protein NGAL_HAMBI490_51290 [Neorhizobium galegae bv. officinalis]